MLLLIALLLLGPSGGHICAYVLQQDADLWSSISSEELQKEEILDFLRGLDAAEIEKMIEKEKEEEMLRIPEGTQSLGEDNQPWTVGAPEYKPIRKKALTVLSRWRPLNTYMKAAASAVTARVSGPAQLDFVSAVTRAHNRGTSQQRRPMVQPLRWGRKRR